jgi:hypothetical protein
MVGIKKEKPHNRDGICCEMEKSMIFMHIPIKILKYRFQDMIHRK